MASRLQDPRTWTWNDLIDIAALIVASAAAVAVASDRTSAIRAIAVVVFSLFIPGWSVVSNWPKMATQSRLAVSVLLSLTILALVATVTVWLHYWHPLGILEVQSGAAVIAIVVAMLRRRGQTPSDHGRVEDARQ